MSARQLNHPNWVQPVSVYTKGGVTPVQDFEIQQVWDGSKNGHRRLRAACVASVEMLRDRTGFEYILWSPVLTGGIDVPLADRQHVNIG